MAEPRSTPAPPTDQLGTLLPGDRVERCAGRFQRFDVIVGTVTVPALLWSSTEPSPTLLVMFNGAVRRIPEKAPEEVFQRSTWVEDIHSDILFIADPTLRSDNEIGIGWGQGTAGVYAIPAMAQTVFSIAESLGIPSTRRMYYGSSAGGFQALQIAARDSGSRALVNNPQIDWTLYLRQSVEAICEHTYAGASADTVTRSHPDRTSAARAFEEFENVPHTRYLVNAASRNDAARQMPSLIAGMSTGPTDITPRIDVSLYVDRAAGHTPLPKAATIDEINHMIDEVARSNE